MIKMLTSFHPGGSTPKGNACNDTKEGAINNSNLYPKIETEKSLDASIKTNPDPLDEIHSVNIKQFHISLYKSLETDVLFKIRAADDEDKWILDLKLEHFNGQECQEMIGSFPKLFEKLFKSGIGSVMLSGTNMICKFESNMMSAEFVLDKVIESEDLLLKKRLRKHEIALDGLECDMKLLDTRVDILENGKTLEAQAFAIELYKLIAKFPDKPWDWGSNGLSTHPNITAQFILDNLHKPWDWGQLSRNPNINMAIVKANPDKNWDWGQLSSNPGITMQDIINNLGKSWNWDWVSDNKNVTMQILKDYSDKQWNWTKLSKNPGITMRDVENNLERPWNWTELIENPNFEMKLVMKHPDKPWNWERLSRKRFQK
jgi:hypothetical protein